MHRNYEKTKNNLNEKLKGMIDMKKILKNGKKAVTGLVLTMMAVCMISSVAQAAYSIDCYSDSKRKADENGYYSYTKVHGFDNNNGSPLNLTVGAKMEGGRWKTKKGAGTVAVRSASIRKAVNAWHSYYVGDGDLFDWMQN